MDGAQIREIQICTRYVQPFSTLIPSAFFYMLTWTYDSRAKPVTRAESLVPRPCSIHDVFPISQP